MNYELIQFPYTKTEAKPEPGNAPTPWEVWRHENIDAEDSAKICGENPWETAEELLARKSEPMPGPGRKPENAAMVRGRALRPLALAAYRALCGGGKGLKPRNLRRADIPWMIAHPDLFDPKTLKIAEVHCGRAALEKAVATGRLPKPYWAEAQHTLAVAGLKFLEVYLHNADADADADADAENDADKIKTGKVFKVWAEREYQAKMLSMEAKFREELLALKGQKTTFRPVMEAVMAAIAGQGPRVDYRQYRSVVPAYVLPDGGPTDTGKRILAPTTAPKGAGAGA